MSTASDDTLAQSSGDGTPEWVLAAMREWLDRHGRLPSSYDWSRTHAQRRGGSALKRLNAGGWPSANVVGRVFGSWGRSSRSGMDRSA